MTAEQNLIRLGIVLPAPPKAVGNYLAWTRTGNLIVTSSQLPWLAGEMKYKGRLGAELSVEEGYQAARLSAVNAIAQLTEAADDLERITRIVRLEGNVHCTAEFRDHPKVLNGASDLFAEVFEDRGRHTRTAVGILSMPLDAAVQISVWAEIAA